MQIGLTQTPRFKADFSRIFGATADNVKENDLYVSVGVPRFNHRVVKIVDGVVWHRDIYKQMTQPTKTPLAEFLSSFSKV